MTQVEQTEATMDPYYEDKPARGERIFYIRDASRRPVGVIAYSFPEEGFVRYASSFLHPNDAFDRSLGRRIALGRLRNDGWSAEEVGYDGSSPLSVVLFALSSSLTTPSRVRRVLNEGIRRRGA